MGEYKTPGVYIKEKNAFGNSIVEVETAIPVFIGLTGAAQDGTSSLLNKPVRISSMTEYNTYFGGAPTPQFILSSEEIKDDDEDKYLFCFPDNEKKMALKCKAPEHIYTLYYHMVLFFANGGGTCYVVSLGGYNADFYESYSANKDTVFANIKKEQDITMVVVPEAVNSANCMNVYTDLLKELADKQKYFALLDVPMGAGAKTEEISDSFGAGIGTTNLQYAAAYYPWLETSVLSDTDIDGRVLVWTYNVDTTSMTFSGDSKVDEYIKKCFTMISTEKDATGKVLKAGDIQQVKTDLHNALLQNWPQYKLLAKKVKDYLNLLPPSAVMAGVYTMIDNTRGVWKAPANVSVSYVNKPAVPVTDKDQEVLNMPMSGKAINAIRTFPGEGIKVWGARTLDGNSQDWRYINVRRTMIFLEQSVKNAARVYVFEPNDANTWINMKCMIENFLRSVWKRGGLAGSTPEEAYEVHVGLGDTMTNDDILEGTMRITVLVAVTRPAEFIEITFQQQAQKS